MEEDFDGNQILGVGLLIVAALAAIILAALAAIILALM